jgi:membrane-bound lytic murein transglycosylase
MLQIQEAQGFARYLRQNPQEVTDLFKDPESFLQLKEESNSPML